MVISFPNLAEELCAEGFDQSTTILIEINLRSEDEIKRDFFKD